jgi:hypothetical protein
MNCTSVRLGRPEGQSRCREQRLLRGAWFAGQKCRRSGAVRCGPRALRGGRAGAGASIAHIASRFGVVAAACGGTAKPSVATRDSIIPKN